MKKAFVHISRAIMNALYRTYCSTRNRSNSVLFLSRQTNTPSYDFAQLAAEFAHQGWQVHMHLKKVKAINMPSYVGHVLRELKLLAECRMVVLDRYDPVVSLIDFRCEEADEATTRAAERAQEQGASLHTEFPAKPVIVQLWHAFGAYKKFGYQSVGTREGHLQRTIDTFNIHRNYSWIMCSGEGSRAAFAEAFAYPIERVVAYNRPEFFELVDIRKQRSESMSNVSPAAEHAPTNTQDPTREPLPANQQSTQTEHTPSVLLAPTLRMSKASAHPFRDLYEQRDTLVAALSDAGVNAKLEWSFHPLEAGLPAPGNASEALLSADVVVTDYSSIAYEAYLLGTPVLFYVPDLDDYRETPGLNVDPAETTPSLCAFTQDELVNSIKGALANPTDIAAALAPFAGPAFDGDPTTTEQQTLLEVVRACS